MTVDYAIEIYDTWGRRVACFAEVPLLEGVRTAPDKADRVEGLLPGGLTELGHGYKVRVLAGGQLFCEAAITRVSPQWGDERKLILDQYVRFQELIAFEAEGGSAPGNTFIARAYADTDVASIVRDAINRAAGSIHYSVDHVAYPDGAVREYQKFLARKTPENELEIGGIAQGQWVGADRMDLSGAYAKDGDTIAGIEVDGQPWPDVRLMMIDAEEIAKNSRAETRHPEVAQWSDDRYNASGYKLRADAAKAALQTLMDSKGIDYIELNPHRDATGAFDDRVDAFGRYIALVYGGGECFNAAMIELGLADVYLYENGRYHVPEMALKEFYSYPGAYRDSIEAANTVLLAYDASGGLLETLTAFAYTAGGYVFSVDPAHGVSFRKPARPDRVWFFDPVEMAVALGSESTGLVNLIHFEGNPISGSVSKTYVRGESIAEYGPRVRNLAHFGVSLESDADKLVEGLLDDLAYPAPSGFVVFFHGHSGVQVGDVIEVRGLPLRRLEREVPGEWQGRFTGRLIGRVNEVAHRFAGSRVSTRVRLTSPLRSVENPIGFMLRSQPGKSELFQFRLDDAGVGLDGAHHLD